MNHQILLLVCTIVLLVNASTFQEKAASGPKSLDEWARTYDLTDPKVLRTNTAELKLAINPVSPNTKQWSTFDIIAKIPQKDSGPINETLVWKVQNEITVSLNRSRFCDWTYNSTYLSFTDAARYTLFGGIKCKNDREYTKLCDDPLFNSNVLFARLITSIKSHIKAKAFTSKVDQSQPWSNALPVPPVNPCPNYANTPHRNWWSDAMTGTGGLDCQMVKDDCTYNQGYGGNLFLIDSGISPHKEFEGLNGTRLFYRTYLSPEELQYDTHPIFDETGHGTALASLTIGKSLGSVKHAKLTSIKAVYWNESTYEDGSPYADFEVSVTAITKALNQIISENKAAGFKAIRPTVIYTGLNLVWTQNSKCHVRFETLPSRSLRSFNKRDEPEEFTQQSTRATPLTPGDLSPNPPISGGITGLFTYDCAYPVVQAVKTVIAFGVPYLTPAMNGFQTLNGVAASGVDMCFFAQWSASVSQCMDYMYLPLFMVNPFASAGQGSSNYGYTNRALIIGGYQEDFENARWSIFDQETGFGDLGGASYGSEWYRINHGRRCVDYAAPAARFQTIPVLKNVLYGEWDASFPGVHLYNVTGNYTTQQYPISGTSYAMPLAAGSILTTLVHFWETLKPTELPDYNFGDRVIEKVDLENVITNAGSNIHVTEDEAIAYVYDYFGWFVTEPDPDNGELSCSSWLQIYYTSTNYPTPVTQVSVPHNRNLKMPKFRSSDPSCRIIGNPVPVPWVPFGPGKTQK